MKTYQNILLIAGTGRNVGKTRFAEKLIQHFSAEHQIIAVKISPHFHTILPDEVLVYNAPECIITQETKINHKDSSRMLQAGAQKVYYIQTEQEHLQQAFEMLLKLTGDLPLICESGGLNRIIKAGLFVLVAGDQIPPNKQHNLNHEPIIIPSNNGNPVFRAEEFLLHDNQWNYKPSSFL